LNNTHQLLVSADDVGLLADGFYVIKREINKERKKGKKKERKKEGKKKERKSEIFIFVGR